MKEGREANRGEWVFENDLKELRGRFWRVEEKGQRRNWGCSSLELDLVFAGRTVNRG